MFYPVREGGLEGLSSLHFDQTDSVPCNTRGVRVLLPAMRLIHTRPKQVFQWMYRGQSVSLMGSSGASLYPCRILRYIWGGLWFFEYCLRFS